MSWLRPLSAWLHSSANRQRQRRLDAQRRARDERAVREFERRHRNCSDVCGTNDCEG